MEKPRTHVPQIHFQPEASYPYDLEIFPVSELRQRTRRDGMRRTYGYTFYMLVLVTEGRSTQWLDFEPRHGEPGHLVMVRPGQVHSFGEGEHWEGWMLLVRPQFLWPASAHQHLGSAVDIERLPACLQLDADGLARATMAMQWMRQDSALHGSGGLDHARLEPGQTAEWAQDMQAHLRHAFHALVSWLIVAYGPSQPEQAHTPPTLKRYHAFKALLEQHVAEWKRISRYAAALGCTERSLTRAVLEAEGISAKELMLKRLGLEAKRLLIHTDWPVGIIADTLGFKEATHFSKFFRRMAGCTPVQFRAANGQG